MWWRKSLTAPTWSQIWFTSFGKQRAPADETDDIGMWHVALRALRIQILLSAIIHILDLTVSSATHAARYPPFCPQYRHNNNNHRPIVDSKHYTLGWYHRIYNFGARSVKANNKYVAPLSAHRKAPVRPIHSSCRREISHFGQRQQQRRQRRAVIFLCSRHMQVENFEICVMVERSFIALRFLCLYYVCRVWRQRLRHVLCVWA